MSPQTHVLSLTQIQSLNSPLNKLLRIAAPLVIASAEASAQDDKAPRRIVVSIPDRKLVLLEGDRILKVYDVAAGKASTPSPSGEFTNRYRAVTGTCASRPAPATNWETSPVPCAWTRAWWSRRPAGSVSPHFCISDPAAAIAQAFRRFAGAGRVFSRGTSVNRMAGSRKGSPLKRSGPGKLWLAVERLLLLLLERRHLYKKCTQLGIELEKLRASTP